LEIEVKIPVECREFEQILKQLEYRRPRIKGPVIEEDHYFAHPCRDFSITDEALRVRYSDNGVTITYKGPRLAVSDKMKVREEIEAKIEKGDIKAILESLGFKEIAVIKKRRTYIEVEDFLVTFDEVEELVCFIEIESTGHLDPLFLASVVFDRDYKPLKETYLELYLKKKKAEELFKEA